MSSSEENARIPSDQKTEGQAETSHEATSEETRHVVDGQKNGQRRCVESDSGPIAGRVCCIM